MRTSLFSAAAACALAVMATGAQAEYAKVADQQTFLSLVAGKVLTRPLVRITVTPDGRIEGRGASWDVTGRWSWENGYFCRDLFWGGDDLGYNCQRVEAEDGKVKFISDRGAGQSAVFRVK